jgi:hypothetical protein
MPQQKSGNWFTIDQPNKKPKKKRQRIPAAFIKRCLDFVPKVRPAYPQRALFMGNIIELESNSLMHDAICEFWNPKSEDLSYTSEIYLGSGSLVGDMYSRRLHEAGFTWCDKDDHVEYKIYDEDRGISGKVDAILDELKIHYYGVKTPKKNKDGTVVSFGNPEPEWFANEFKQTGVSKYAAWECMDDLPLKYQCQFSLYADYLFEWGITKHKEGMFTIICRDDPNKVKTIWVECDDQLVKRAFKVAERFWGHIQNRDFPAAEGKKDLTEKEIEDIIMEQPQRKWPKLANIGEENDE